MGWRFRRNPATEICLTDATSFRRRASLCNRNKYDLSGVYSRLNVFLQELCSFQPWC